MSSYYRLGVWYTRGLKRYTKSGYETASKNFTSLDNLDVSGRSFMITGANSGIGKVAALDIARRGGTVHMVCRDETRGKAAQEEVQQVAKGGEIKLHILDMAESEKVFKFAREFVKEGNELHVLVNNAGCMLHERQLDENGVEKNFAVNTLAPYILTTALIDHMKQFKDPRVVTVTSGGMLLVKLNPDDLDFHSLRPFKGDMAYSFNKRQQIVITDHWAKQYKDIHFSTMHPGWADTPAVRTSIPDFYEKMKDKLRTPEQGADTLSWLCMAPEARDAPSGGFFEDRVAVKKHLPLAWTSSSAADELRFMKNIEELSEKIRKKAMSLDGKL